MDNWIICRQLTKGWDYYDGAGQVWTDNVYKARRYRNKEYAERIRQELKRHNYHLELRPVIQIETGRQPSTVKHKYFIKQNGLGIDTLWFYAKSIMKTAEGACSKVSFTWGASSGWAHRFDTWEEAAAELQLIITHSDPTATFEIHHVEAQMTLPEYIKNLEEEYVNHAASFDSRVVDVVNRILTELKGLKQ